MVNLSKTSQQRFWTLWKASGAVKPFFRSGYMPRTDFSYEDFEGLLGSYYLTYRHMEDSSDYKVQEAFKSFKKVLENLANMFNVQVPHLAIKNVRSRNKWGVPEKFESYFSVKDCIGSFYRDFGIVQTSEMAKEEVHALARFVTSPAFIF